jgi:hypothetical protein
VSARSDRGGIGELSGQESLCCPTLVLASPSCGGRSGGLAAAMMHWLKRRRPAASL